MNDTEFLRALRAIMALAVLLLFVAIPGYGLYAIATKDDPKKCCVASGGPGEIDYDYCPCANMQEAQP